MFYVDLSSLKYPFYITFYAFYENTTMLQNAGLIFIIKACVQKKKMATDVGVKKSFMVATVKRKMNAFLIPVFMATVQIILKIIYIYNCSPGYTGINCETEIDECESIIFVTVLQVTLVLTVRLKQMNVNQLYL